jgi:hypothetical protein
MVLVGAVLFVLLSVNMMLKGAHIYLLGAERGAPSHRQELSEREKLPIVYNGPSHLFIDRASFNRHESE